MKGSCALAVGIALLAGPALGQISIQPLGAAEAGRRLFRETCASCHDLTENRYGPSLGEVYGRQAGSAPGYNYSNALRGQGFTWTTAELDAWLQDPRAFRKGARMSFREKDPAKRANIIAYLRSLKGRP